MELDTLNIIHDTIIHRDTIQVYLGVDLSNSEFSRLYIESLIKEESNKLSNYFLPSISVLIAFGALVLSYFALQKNKLHNKVSIKPLLFFRERITFRTGKVKLFIQNKGVGPLVFSKFDMIYEGNTYHQMWDIFDLIQKKFELTKEDFDLDYRGFTFSIEDYSLKVDEEHELLKYSLKNKTQEEAFVFYKEFKKIEFRYTFKDLYDKIESGSFRFNKKYSAFGR